jgi:hypothetical protein
MLLKMALQKRILTAVYLTLFVMTSSAQKSDKDSVLTQINKRLDLITSKIDSNTRVLTDSIQKLNSSLSFLSTELGKWKINASENQRKADDFSFINKNLQSNLTAEKNNDQRLVSQMIEAISHESYRVNKNLASAILEMARIKESPGLSKMEHFFKAYELINAASQCLNTPYNPGVVKDYLGKLNDFGWKLFPVPALEIDKVNLIELLEEYCSEYNFISKEINDTRGMSSEDRKRILESKKYRVEEYPYLTNLLNIAIQNKDTPLTLANCPPQK